MQGMVSSCRAMFLRDHILPVSDTMSPAPAAAKSSRPVPERFQILVSRPSSAGSPVGCMQPYQAVGPPQSSESFLKLLTVELTMCDISQ